jgi:hypothetical protein
MLKRATGIVVAAGVLSLPLLIASPASAATLPVGDTLYAISCDYDDEQQQGFADLYAVNPDTADLTFVGGTGHAEDCAGPAAYDPTTGKSYYLSWDNDSLAIIDVATGASTLTAITGDGSDAPDGLAIGADGRGWIIWQDDLYSVNLATAVSTLVTPLAVGCLYSFALDPTDGKFYAIQCSTGDAYQINVDNGVLTPIGTVALTAQSYAMQIDTAGRWWVHQDTGEQAESSLWSTPRPSGPTVMEYEGDFIDSANEAAPYVESLLLTYPLKLAATGASTDVAPVVAVGVAAAAFGAALLLTVGRRRRSA